MTKLEMLNLSDTAVSDDGLKHLEGLKNLRELHLGNEVTDARLKSLEPLRRLQTLSIGGYSLSYNSAHPPEALEHSKVVGGGLKFLASLPELRTLHLSLLDDPGLQGLQVLKNLTALYVDGVFTDAAVEHLKDLEKLQTLRIDSWFVTGKGFAYLKGLTQLEELDVSGTAIADDDLENLEGLSHLKRLWLRGDKNITNAGLKHLKKLPKLRDLVIEGTGTTSAGLEELKDMRQLRHLMLNRDTSSEAVEKLQKSLPNCEIVWSL